MLRTGPWGIAACYGLQGAANSMWFPARQRWLYGLIVDEPGRAAANAGIGSVSGAATLPLFALARPSSKPDAGTGAVSRPLRTDLAEGFTALRYLPLARSVIWIGVAWGFIGGAYNILLAAYVADSLHGGGLLLGAFYCVDGVAVILGAALAARAALRWHVAGYACAYVLQGAAWGAMFLGSQAALAAALLAVMRTASGVIIALDTTILLTGVPARLRGRITSLHMTTYNAVSRVALAAFAGVLAVTGVRAAGMAAGAASVLVGAAWWALNGQRARSFYTGAASAGGRPDDRTCTADETETMA